MSEVAETTTTKAEAERHVERIKGWVKDFAKLGEQVWTALETAHREQHWIVLGYPSWDDYFAGELAETVKAVDPQQRRPWIRQLYDLGMSQRMVADLTGVSQSTVHRETSNPSLLIQVNHHSRGVNQTGVVNQSLSVKTGNSASAPSRPPPPTPNPRRGRLSNAGQDGHLLAGTRTKQRKDSPRGCKVMKVTEIAQSPALNQAGKQGGGGEKEPGTAMTSPIPSC